MLIVNHYATGVKGEILAGNAEWPMLKGERIFVWALFL